MEQLSDHGASLSPLVIAVLNTSIALAVSVLTFFISPSLWANPKEILHEPQGPIKQPSKFYHEAICECPIPLRCN